MNAHPVLGAQIIAPVTKLAPELPIIRHHHEWYNGSGYPDRLIGDEIPKLARVLHVADAFEAMTAARPYRMTPLTTRAGARRAAQVRRRPVRPGRRRCLRPDASRRGRAGRRAGRPEPRQIPLIAQAADRMTAARATSARPAIRPPPRHDRRPSGSEPTATRPPRRRGPRRRATRRARMMRRACTAGALSRRVLIGGIVLGLVLGLLVGGRLGNLADDPPALDLAARRGGRHPLRRPRPLLGANVPTRRGASPAAPGERVRAPARRPLGEPHLPGHQPRLRRHPCRTRSVIVVNGGYMPIWEPSLDRGRASDRPTSPRRST